MSAAFSAIAVVALVLAFALFVRARRRISRAEVHRGRIASMSELSPGAPLANQLVVSHSAYQRFVIDLQTGKVTADSYLPRSAGDVADLLLENGRYTFKFDAYMPALFLAAVAALAAVIAVILSASRL